MTLEDCLPPSLRGPATTITKIAGGLSGAGVYRVEAGGQAYVLKISGDDPLADWRRKVAVLQRAAGAGVAAPVIHVDEERRAVVSAFATDRSIAALLGNPQTRDDAIALLGHTLRRVHDLPTADAAVRDARDLLARIDVHLTGFAVPSFVREAIRTMLAEQAPPSGRSDVLSHNDVNPSNLVFDGERVLLLDWDTAGINDAFYDLAAVALFLRLDEGACLKLLAAHDGEPVSALPARFTYDRRLVATACGAIFLELARATGHPGDTSEAARSLAEVYQAMRTGAVDLTGPDGRWQLGLALIKEVQ